MMDKKKIGEYLKQLRKQKLKENGKNYSQADLSDDFLINHGVDISINAIAEWENGNSLPSPEKLEILSIIYGKSIDEILDGEDKQNVNYKDIYFICNEGWASKFDRNDNLYQIRNEQILKVVSKFKELIIKRIKNDLSYNEENEFRFLFDNFYTLSDYAKQYSSLEINDEYLVFKDALYKLLIQIRNMSFEEKYWEVQKLYSENRYLWFTFRLDVHDLKNVDILKSRFDKIDDWQKDMLLDMFQNMEPFDNNPEKYGSSYLKRYEENYGEYNHDDIAKSEIRELIKRGACINKCFFNVKRQFKETYRIIDRLEELYNLCLKPIEVYMGDDEGKVITYQIQNNFKNRFLDKYYFTLLHSLDLYKPEEPPYCHLEEIYQWFKNNDEITDDVYLRIAKKYNIDTNQDKKYWLADVKEISSIESMFNGFKAREKAIEEGLKEIQNLEKMLNDGITEYSRSKTEIIGGSDEDTIRRYSEFWKSSLTYEEYLKGRDKTLTKQLLLDLEKMTMSEIKNKYFGLEVINNE